MERKQKITWDEEAIAEHDKERGSRQKIDEAPTPYRYGSESDQSEGESGDHDASKGTTSNQNEPEANKGQTTKEFEDNRVLFRSPAGSHNVISDSWEALNAKLHYEKHLQDLKVRGNNDAIQRREFYQSGTSSNINSSSNNNNNNNSSSNNSTMTLDVSTVAPPPPPPTFPKITPTGTTKSSNIEDLQTNFGEIVNPVPAAFSPFFTRKQFRPGSAGNNAGCTSSNRKNQQLNIQCSSGSADDIDALNSATPTNGYTRDRSNATTGSTGSTGGSGTGSSKTKSVFIKGVSDQYSPIQSTAMFKHPNDFNVTNSEDDNALLNNRKDQLFAGINGSVGDRSRSNSNEGKSKFLDKRAGHYNEFKVLQAMRARQAAIDDDDDDDDDVDDYYGDIHTNATNTTTSTSSYHNSNNSQNNNTNNADLAIEEERVVGEDQENPAMDA